MLLHLSAIAIIVPVFDASAQSIEPQSINPQGTKSQSVQPKITSCNQVTQNNSYQVFISALTNTINSSDLDSDNPAESRNAEPEIMVATNQIPSLWWARQQFDPFGGRLVSDWSSNPKIRQIDLTVNWQLWTLLDYLARYRFVNQFGTVARQYGYNLRVFNQQQQCLAIYYYNQQSDPPKWEIQLEGLGQDSLPVVPTE